MAIYWIDYINGNDDTGDGSQTNPWQKINKATYGSDAPVNPGDEIRIAKSPDPTVLSGTLSWENNSREIATSEDMTGILAKYDFIGKANIDNTDETWWEIHSITSNKITLKETYYGASETIASKKLGTTDTGTFGQGIYNSGSEDSPILFSGGWDLSTGEQNGMTFFRQTGSGYNGNGIFISSCFILLKKIGFLRYEYGVDYCGYTNTGNNITFEEVHILSCNRGIYPNNTSSSVSNTANNITMKNCLSAHNRNYAIALRSKTNSGNNFYAENCCFTRSKGIQFSAYGHGSIVKNCRFFNTISAAIWYMNDGEINNCSFKQTINDSMFALEKVENSSVCKCQFDGNNVDVRSCTDIIFSQCLFKNNLDYVFYYPKNIKLYSCSIIGQLTTYMNSDDYSVIFHRENDIPYNHRNIFKYGETGCHSAFAHSGEACVRLSSADADYPVKINAIIKYIPSSANDVEVNVFAKRESDFNGTLKLKAMVLGEIIATVTPAFINSEMENIPEPLPIDYDGSAPTLDWCKYKFIIPKNKLVAGEFLMIEASAIGTAGSVFVDE